MSYRASFAAGVRRVAVTVTLALGGIVAAEQKSLIIGVENIDNLPQYGIRNGEYIGIGREIFASFAADRGYRVIYKPEPIRQLVDDMIKGKVDLKFPDNAAWNSEAKQGASVRYSEVVDRVVGGAMVRPENAGRMIGDIRLLATLQGYTATGWQDPIAAGKVKLVEYPDPVSLLDAVIAGKADAAFLGTAAASYKLKEMGKNGALVFNPLLPFETTAFHVSSGRRPELIEEFDAWLASHPAKVQVILAKFGAEISEASTIATTPQLALSPEQKAYLAQKGGLKLCVNPDYMPVERLTEQGKYEGIFADIMGVIGRKLDVRIEPQAVHSWPEAVDMVKARKCDVLTGAIPTKSRLAYLDFTTPVINFPTVVATRNGEPYFDSIRALYGKPLGVVSGSALVETLPEFDPNLQLVEVPSLLAGLNMVRDGGIYGLISGSTVLGYQMQARGFSYDLKVSGQIEDKGLYPLTIGIRNDEPILRPILQKAVDALPQEQRDAIVGRWISVRFDRGVDYRLVWRVVGIAAVIIIAIAVWLWKLQSLYRQIQKGRDAVTNLLDNADQGFLFFGADLIVGAEFSRACVAMLGGPPAGCPVEGVLFPGDAPCADLFRATTAAIFAGGSVEQQELRLSLLPERLEVGGLELKAAYRLLEDGKIMVVLSDITEELRLSEGIEDERRRLTMIVAALTDSGAFFGALNSFRSFASVGLRETIHGTAAPAALLAETYRLVHTFKGVLAQIGFARAPKLLHDLEGRLQELLERDQEPSRKEIADAVHSAGFLDAMETDLASLRDVLGDDFLEGGERLVLSERHAGLLLQLTGRLKRGEAVDLQSPEIAQLFDEIGRIRQTNLRKVLRSYDGVLAQLAARLGKRIAPIDIPDGQDCWLDSRSFRPFLAALVHVFRNALVHGIETPAQRRDAGKAEEGKISCTVAVEEGVLLLTIADDGAGLDLAALRRKAGRESLSDRQARELIFSDSMTTREAVDELSGRGVGLAAVRAAARALGGEVAVESEAGLGTRFRFTLPMLEQEGLVSIFYPRAGRSDRRDDYPVALLKLLLEKSGGRYVARPSLETMEQDAALFELSRKDGGVDVAWSMTSIAREETAAPIRYCIYKGLIGWRVALLKAEKAEIFAETKDRGSLRRFAACQGHDWPDTEILRVNGVSVEALAHYEELFDLLLAGGADFFPRSVMEAGMEEAQHAARGIVIDRHLLIRYPAATYFFVNPANRKLAEDLTRGFEAALADGSFDRLFFEHHRTALEDLALAERRVIELDNPLLPPTTPLGRPDLWFVLTDMLPTTKPLAKPGQRRLKLGASSFAKALEDRSGG